MKYGAIKVYAIMSGGDLPFGTAYDGPTMLSLVELAKLKGASGVSIHAVRGFNFPYSGEKSFADAVSLVMDNKLF
jgi:hypothetical protein